MLFSTYSNTVSFKNYEDLLEQYRSEIFNFLGNDSRKPDNTCNRHLLKLIHEKYKHYQEIYFPDVRYDDFSYLFVNGENIIKEN